MKFSEEHAFGMLIIRGRSDLAYHRDGEKRHPFQADTPHRRNLHKPQ